MLPLKMRKEHAVSVPAGTNQGWLDNYDKNLSKKNVFITPALK